MAEWETTTVAPGVERHDAFYGYTLYGTREALLASGLVKEAWIWNGRCGADGRRLRTVRFKVDGNDGVSRPDYHCDGEYVVEFCYPQEETDKRRAAEEQATLQRLALQAVEARRERMRKALAEKGGIRKIVDLRMRSGEALVLAAFNAVGDPGDPWTFPAETIEQAKWHLREIMTLLEAGGYKERPGVILQGDAAFQRFVGLAVNGKT